jgi:hypothetical protein
MNYITNSYPLILLKKVVDYVLNVSAFTVLQATRGTNIYSGDIQINKFYPIATNNGNFVSYEFRPKIVIPFQGKPVNKEIVTDTISYSNYDSSLNFTYYYNDIYITSYNNAFQNSAYTLNIQTEVITSVDSSITNKTYTYEFGSDIFVIRGKELYVFENNLRVNNDIMILGNGELRIIDNLVT